MNQSIDFRKEIVLENEAVRLEPLQIAHTEHLSHIAINHPKLLQYSPSPFGSEKMLACYIEGALDARFIQSRYPFAIFDKASQSYVGSTSYGAVSNYDRRLEIGWTWLNPSHQGTGLNQQCKRLLLCYAFETLGFERVEFKTDSRNVQSRKAIEKVGASFEGELRNHILLPDGFRRNTVYYSILANEWKTIKASMFKRKD